jgi:hypothetical protein
MNRAFQGVVVGFKGLLSEIRLETLGLITVPDDSLHLGDSVWVIFDQHTREVRQVVREAEMADCRDEEEYPIFEDIDPEIEDYAMLEVEGCFS